MYYVVPPLTGPVPAYYGISTENALAPRLAPAPLRLAPAPLTCVHSCPAVTRLTPFPATTPHPPYALLSPFLVRLKRAALCCKRSGMGDFSLSLGARGEGLVYAEQGGHVGERAAAESVR